jgi:hypothetical protein
VDGTDDLGLAIDALARTGAVIDVATDLLRSEAVFMVEQPAVNE